MFVRSQIHRGRPVYWLVESYRDGKRMRRRKLAYLGQHETLEAAIDGTESAIAENLQFADQREEEGRRLLDIAGWRRSVAAAGIHELKQAERLRREADQWRLRLGKLRGFASSNQELDNAR